MNYTASNGSTGHDVAGTLNIKGIIFDMDGTLLQSTEADYRAWEKVFNKYDQELPFMKYAPMLGKKSVDVVKYEIGFTNEQDVQRILKEKFDFFVKFIAKNPIQPVFAAERFLQSLAPFPF